MKKTIVTKLPAGDIIEIKRLDDGTYEIIQNVPEVSRNIPVSIFKNEETANRVRQLATKSEVPDDAFVLVKAESLSLDYRFMRYEPQTESEENTKKLIIDAINAKVKNFYRPKYDPSFSVDGKGICFVAGKEPALDRSYRWWANTAMNYCPSRNSRLGTRLQYGAFLGVLIKKLAEEGRSFEEAWSSVCNDSRELGHYWNAEYAKHRFEWTGSRCVCGYYDLANTRKILADDEETGDFWLAGGSYDDGSRDFPLAGLGRYYGSCFDCLKVSVGWLVLS